MKQEITKKSQLPLVQCLYNHRYPTAEETLAMIGLTSTFAFLLVGRTATGPVWTPNSMPGPNKSDLVS